MTSGTGVGGVHLSALKDTLGSDVPAVVYLRPSRVGPLDDQEIFTCWLRCGVALGLALDGLAVWVLFRLARRKEALPQAPGRRLRAARGRVATPQPPT